MKNISADKFPLYKKNLKNTDRLWFWHFKYIYGVHTFIQGFNSYYTLFYFYLTLFKYLALCVKMHHFGASKQFFILVSWIRLWLIMSRGRFRRLWFWVVTGLWTYRLSALTLGCPISGITHRKKSHTGRQMTFSVPLFSIKPKAGSCVSMNVICFGWSSSGNCCVR